MEFIPSVKDGINNYGMFKKKQFKIKLECIEDV